MSNIYEFYKESNKDHLNDFILNFNNKEFTHKDLIKMADECAKSLIAMGVKENDPVAIWLVNTPELVAFFLAVSKIGAVAEFIDPRVTPEQIKAEFKVTNPKLFIPTTIYQFDRFVNDIANDSSVDKVISVSPAESFGVIGKFLVSVVDKVKSAQEKKHFAKELAEIEINSLKKTWERKILSFFKRVLEKKETITYINWNKFLSLGKNVIIDKSSKSGGGILIKTSGTSKGMKAGYGKLIKLTQENAIALARQHQIKQKELNISRGDTVMSFAPFSLAYGCLDATIMPLSMGVKLILMPDFDPNKMAEYVLKYKPNHLLTCPAYIEIMKKSPLITKDTDLSFIKTIVAGGEKYDLSKIKDTNKFLHEHNVPTNVEVTVGYGKNEISSACTYTFKSPETIGEKYTELGGNYIGEPLPGNIIKIVDDNFNELPEKTVGKIIVAGPTVMEGYYKNDELNKESFYVKDGILYHDTEDLGYYIAGIGFWCKGRESRQMYDQTGKKIDYEAIENLISNMEEIDNCMVVQNKDTGDLILYVSLKPEYFYLKDMLQEKIKNLIFDKFNSEPSLLPKYISVLEKFPITENAKKCWVELEKLKINSEDRCEYLTYSKQIKKTKNAY